MRSAAYFAILQALGVAFGVAACAHQAPTMQAKVLRVLDGDTIEVDAALWLTIAQQARQMRAPVLVRVLGVDTPELKAQKTCEREMARQARDFSTAWAGSAVELEIVQLDKYSGRVDAHVTRNGKSLADALIAAGLGRPYSGGARNGWC